MVLLLPVLLLSPLGAAAGPFTATRAAERRDKLLRARGGHAGTEKAVEAALGWLAAHQSESGAWDADGFMDVSGCDCDGKGGGWHGEPVPCGFDTEVTALATLAFLGAGHTHRDGAHKENVARALAWLERRGRGETLFATAYVTRVFAEAFDMTGDVSLRREVERGVAVMLGSRQPQAGWRYAPGNRMASGVPTTSAVVCALRTAAEAGFEVERGYETQLLAWLDGLVDKDTGRVAYTVDGHLMGYTPTRTNAASALLMRVWLGRPVSDAEVARGVKTILGTKPKWSIKWKRMKVNGVMRDVQIGYLQHYYWWHGCEALARLDGAAWKSWNGALKKALLGKQRDDGHAKGSWDPAGTYGKVAGRVYSTALCARMLESYYLYPAARADD